MNTKELYEILGIRFHQLVSKLHYPSIDTSIISSDHCSEIRSHWYGLPSSDNKLKEQVIRIIEKGIIEEIRDKDTHQIFIIKVKYKSERYHIELTLTKQWEWSFSGIQYIGVAPKPKKYMIIAVFAALVIGLATIYPTLSTKGNTLNLKNKLSTTNSTETSTESNQTASKTEETTEANKTAVKPLTDSNTKKITTPSKANNTTGQATSTNLSQIKKIANEQQHVVLSKSEYQELVNKNKALQQKVNQVSKQQAAAKQTTSKQPTTTAKQAGTQPALNKPITINVKQGMTSLDVSEQLIQKFGLSKTKQQVNNRFIQLKLESKIKVGTFTISPNASLEQIIRTITKS